MNSKRALFMLMINQKKVRDGFKLVDLNTMEKVSIEECYEIVLDDLEKLEQENKELKEQVNHFKKVIEVMQNSSKLDCTHMFDNCEKLTPLTEKNKDKITRIEEALEITRLKNVDTDLIKKCYGELAYALYNSCMKYRSDKLTKEEFDLLKEIEK